MTLEELQAQIDEMKASDEANQQKIASLSRENLKWRRIAQGKEAIDPEELDKLRAELEDTKSALSKAEKTYKSEIEKTSKALSEKDGALQKFLIDGGLSDALAKAGVAPQFMDAAKALLRQQAQIKAEDGNYQALMGDKPLTDAIKEWASSETGKHFVLATRNSGGGAPGSQSGSTVKPFKDMTSEERTALYRKDPAQYEQLKNATA